jgi:hypothetical protein
MAVLAESNHEGDRGKLGSQWPVSQELTAVPFLVSYAAPLTNSVLGNFCSATAVVGSTSLAIINLKVQ